jgi:hypothetical protein
VSRSKKTDLSGLAGRVFRCATRQDSQRRGVRSKAVYPALAVLPDGTRDILGVWIEQMEGAKFWLKVFNDLKRVKIVLRGRARRLSTGGGCGTSSMLFIEAFPRCSSPMLFPDALPRCSSPMPFPDAPPRCSSPRGITSARGV